MYSLYIFQTPKKTTTISHYLKEAHSFVDISFHQNVFSTHENKIDKMFYQFIKNYIYRGRNEHFKNLLKKGLQYWLKNHLVIKNSS